MRKKIIALSLIIISLFIVTGCGKKSSDLKSSDFDGIYKNGGIELKLIALSDDTIRYYAIDEEETEEEGYLDFKDGIASYDDGETKDTFTLDSKKVIVKRSTEDEVLTSGTYTRKGDYTIDELYKEFFGDEKHFDSEYNGYYTNEDGYIGIYTPDGKILRIEGMYSEDEGFGFDAEITKDNKYTAEMFDEKYTIEIKDNSLEFSVTYEDDKEPAYKGTFNKKGKMTKQDIANYYEDYYADYEEDEESEEEEDEEE